LADFRIEAQFMIEELADTHSSLAMILGTGTIMQIGFDGPTNELVREGGNWELSKEDSGVANPITPLTHHTLYLERDTLSMLVDIDDVPVTDWQALYQPGSVAEFAFASKGGNRFYVNDFRSYCKPALIYQEEFELCSDTTYNVTTNLTQAPHNEDMVGDWQFLTTAEKGFIQFIGLPGDKNDVYQFHKGTHAAALSPMFELVSNFLIWTVDLQWYAPSTDVELEFYIYDYGEEEQPNDRVWMRGSPADDWIEIYDIKNAPYREWRRVSVDVDAVLSSATPAQVMTEKFQVMWGEEDEYEISSDGYSIDDVALYGTLIPSVSPTSSVTSTATVSVSPTVSDSPTSSISQSPTSSISQSSTSSVTASPTRTASATSSRTASSSPTTSPTASPSDSATTSISVSVTSTPSPTASISITPSTSLSPSNSPDYICIDYPTAGPPDADWSDMKRCLYGNTLDDGYHYFYNLDIHGETLDLCNFIENCECCRHLLPQEEDTARVCMDGDMSRIKFESADGASTSYLDYHAPDLLETNAEVQVSGKLNTFRTAHGSNIFADDWEPNFTYGYPDGNSEDWVTVANNSQHCHYLYLDSVVTISCKITMELTAAPDVNGEGKYEVIFFSNKDLPFKSVHEDIACPMTGSGSVGLNPWVTLGTEVLYLDSKQMVVIFCLENSGGAFASNTWEFKWTAQYSTERVCPQP
jgi:hypothetical protein